MFSRASAEIIDADSQSLLSDSHFLTREVVLDNGEGYAIGVRVDLPTDGFEGCESPKDVADRFLNLVVSGDYKIDAVVAERPL